jgi:HSP20 family molecular chaperone IbpA
MFEDDMDNICEGCMVHNTGENFSHAGFCKACMGAMMDAPTDEVLKGDDHLTNRLAKNADSKIGALTSWRDTDGAEVEIILPMPPGVDKKELVMKVTPQKLLVRVGERKLLFVDPLFDLVKADETCWCLEPAKDGSTQMQISLTKAVVGTRWGKTLCREGGFFECWMNSLLEAPKEPGADLEGAPAVAGTTAGGTAGGSAKPDPSLTRDGKKKPRFTMRDDGAEVEINLPLPEGVSEKKQLKVKATTTSLHVQTDKGRSLLEVKPLLGDIVPDELMWTLEKAKDGQVHAQLTLAKIDESFTWEGSLTKPGGTFVCWTTEL